jgi:Ca2+-binding EF-hand superfamily protein
VYSNTDAWSNFVGAGGHVKKHGAEIGRYSIEVSENQLVYHEGPLSGALQWDGEWFAGALADNLKAEGEIRLRKYRYGVQSQFRKAGEEQWDDAILAKRVQSVAKNKNMCKEKLQEHPRELTSKSLKVEDVPALDQTDIEVDQSHSSIHLAAEDQIDIEVDRIDSIARMPAEHRTNVEVAQIDSSLSQAVETIPMKFKPSVGTWLMRLPQPVHEMPHQVNDSQVTSASDLLVCVSADLIHPCEQHQAARGDLDCEELMKTAVEQFEPEDAAQESIFTLFKSLDANHDGSINRTEFFSGLWGGQANKLLKELGVGDSHLSGTGHEVLQELFELADADGNGVITFFEFMHALNKKVGKQVLEG